METLQGIVWGIMIIGLILYVLIGLSDGPDQDDDFDVYPD